MTVAAEGTAVAAKKSFRKPDVMQKLKEETEAAKVLIEHLKAAELFDDGELVSDTVEGETNLFELIDEALKKLGIDKAHAAALKNHEQELADRRGRMEAAYKKGRAAIGLALKAIGQKTYRSAFGTTSIRDGERELIITEEADIPSKYWIIPEPVQPPAKLDKDALLADLEQREKFLLEIKAAEDLCSGDPTKDKQALAYIAELKAAMPDISGARLGDIKLITSIRGK